MSFSQNYSQIKSLLGKIECKVDYPLGSKTRYKTGGNCSLAVFPKTEEEFISAVSILRGECPIETVGAGTNLLVSDSGFNGAVIFTDYMIKTRQSGKKRSETDTAVQIT